MRLGQLTQLAVIILKKQKQTFCGFSMGRNQYWAGRVYDLCVYYMTGTPEGSTESGFMEKPGIEPATPGLQGIALIHYTTGASLVIDDSTGCDVVDDYFATEADAMIAFVC